MEEGGSAWVEKVEKVRVHGWSYRRGVIPEHDLSMNKIKALSHVQWARAMTTFEAEKFTITTLNRKSVSDSVSAPEGVGDENGGSMVSDEEKLK